MTVAAALTETVYSLVGSSLGPFSTVWPYNAPGDVTVQIDYADGAGPHLLGQGVDYFLTASNPTLSNGGSVTLAAHVLTSPTWPLGALLALVRITPRSQPSSFGEAVGFSPKASEQALDNVERQVQELTAWMRRSVQVGYGESAPVIDQVDSSLWGIDADGDFQSFIYGSSPMKVIGTNAASELTFYPWPPPGEGGGGGEIIAGAGITVGSYADIRSGNYLQAAGAPISITLADPYLGGIFIPAPPGQRDDGGVCLVDTLGQSWRRVYSGRVSAAWFYNAPTGHLGDGAALAITAADAAANPQWIGMPDGSGPYPVGATWGYVALQEWIYTLCAGASRPGHVAWNVSVAGQSLQNLSGGCPPGAIHINQQLLINASGLDIEFAARLATQIVWNGNATGTSNVGPAIYFNSLSYSVIKNLNVLDAVGTTNCVVAFDYQNHSIPQINNEACTFHDWSISGVSTLPPSTVPYVIGLSQCGIALAPFTFGLAQGDTFIFINLFVQGFIDGFQVLGDNAVHPTFIGGNFQSCYRNCIFTVCGLTTINTLFEAVGGSYGGYPALNQLMLGGADLTCGNIGTTNSTMIGARSESIVLCSDANRSTVISSSSIVSSATTTNWTAGAHVGAGLVFNAAGTGYSMAAVADDGGPAWFISDPASTSTVIINPNSPGWTPGQWADGTWGLWLRFRNSFTLWQPIVANDDHTLTVQNPYVLGAPVTGAHGFKISGRTGSTAPPWATPTIFGRPLAHGNVYQGFTTTVGSNLVQVGSSALTVGNAIAVGHWVIVCGALSVTQENTTITGPLIGKISAMNAGPSGTQILTLVDNAGAPVNAGVAVTDGLGYYGAGIVDGHVTWLPIDWDVLYGVARADNLYASLGGRAANCGEMMLEQPPYGGVGGNFIRSTSAGNGRSFYYQDLAQYRGAQPQIIVGSSPHNLTLAAGGLGYVQTLQYGYQLAACTINFPTLGDGTTFDFDLVMLCSYSAGGTVITWGTNVKAAAATVTLGALNQKTVARMKWIGNGAGGGSWYVVGLQGPM